MWSAFMAISAAFLSQGDHCKAEEMALRGQMEARKLGMNREDAADKKDLSETKNACIQELALADEGRQAHHALQVSCQPQNIR